MTLTELAAFFGWCTIINMALLILASLFIAGARGWMMPIHTKLMGVGEAELPGHYFRYLANYKIAIIVFNLAPYIALRIIA